MDGRAFTVRLNGWELLPTRFVAVAVNVATPSDAGVPLITPVEAFKVSPEGSAPPVTDQVIGMLPEAVTVWEYAVPTSAAGRGELVVIAGAAETVRLKLFELLPTALVAATVNVATPLALGIPLRTPVDAFKVSPFGSDPLVTDQAIGVVPEALKV
jgi:hypothetical protein